MQEDSTDSSSESSLEDLEDAPVEDQDDGDVQPPVTAGNAEQVTLQQLLARTPPLLTGTEASLNFPSSVVDSLDEAWDVDGLEVCLSPADMVERIGSCNIQVKSIPER